MKALSFLILLIILAGCKENETTVQTPKNQYKYSVNVIFQSGFQSDSVIVKADTDVVFLGIAKSDSIHGFPNGCVFNPTKEFHTLSVEIPMMHITNDTVVFIQTDAGTRIDAHLDRQMRKMTFDINYIIPQN